MCTQDCVCSDCHNDGKHEEQRLLAVRSIRLNSTEQDTERGCRCKRSQCQKKYCECFGNGNKCTTNCICDDCGNGNPNSNGGAGSISKTLGKLQQIDLERLRKEVASRGGLAKVDQCREWRQIARAMDLAPNSTADPLRRRFLAATRDDDAAAAAAAALAPAAPDVPLAPPAPPPNGASAPPMPPPAVH
eukprot:CAMPEP_0173112484 /NCGR_PEP_ID=MMETSP1102-20130122/46072_1 /TAXON_ID=49646 /ORGANISM="Geminigera sp., Strain Caron Lab Isolate" /LENGTH=188 /DNA_ID=CAMNT_0014013617 /DNA_START=336 /DNA_END=902 /DNA_ORIENTATION=-